MIWDEIYRAAMVCIGERADNPIFYEQALTALKLDSIELEEARKAYLYAHGLPIPCGREVEVLLEESHFPSAFFAVLTYGLASVLLRNDDSERAKEFATLKASELSRLLSDLPARVHPIADCYR